MVRNALESDTNRDDASVLLEGMDIDDEQIARRKKFLELKEDDEQRLERLHALTQQSADEIIDAFYSHMLSFEETRAFFDNPKLLENLKARQKEYFLRLTLGNYQLGYVEDRLRMVTAHERIGLPINAYIGMYNFYLQAVAERMFADEDLSGDGAVSSFLSLIKLMFLDISLATDTYVYQRERTISDQQEAIREIATPVLQVREGMLILPIIGVIDTVLAHQMTEQLLRAIRATRAKVVVMDITGVPAVDSTVANHLVQTVEAARLLGATAIVTGLSPAIAQTLVTIGLDLSQMNCMGDLQGGMEAADRILGMRLVPVE